MIEHGPRAADVRDLRRSVRVSDCHPVLICALTQSCTVFLCLVLKEAPHARAQYARGRATCTTRVSVTADSPRNRAFYACCYAACAENDGLRFTRARDAGHLVAPVPRETGGICTRPAASFTPPPHERTLLLRQGQQRKCVESTLGALQQLN